MMKHLGQFFLVGIVTSCVIGTTAGEAVADNYRAGEFTITLNDGENGYSYIGCNPQGECINLESGTKWRDHGYRGITWENGDYTYSVSWRENANEEMYLNIYNKGQRILRRKLVAIP